MPNTFFGLTIGKSGLYTASNAMNTTAHNIANTETKGYCRQISIQRANKALHIGNATGMIGTVISVILAIVQLVPHLAVMEAMGSEAFFLLSLWCSPMDGSSRM